MKPTLLLMSLVAAAAGLASFPIHAQAPSSLEGVWTLDRSASEPAHDIGFDMPFGARGLGGAAQGQDGGSNGRGRGRESSAGDNRGGSEPVFPRPESYEQAQLISALTDEARNPPARMTIIDTPTAVTMTTDLGLSRTLHPNGQEESIEIHSVPVETTAKRTGNDLQVNYVVDSRREVRYTYSSPDPSRLIVDVQFLTQGAGDKARRVYQRLPMDSRAQAVPAPAEPPPATRAAARAVSPAGGAVPAAGGQQASAALDQSPGAELKGLTTLGIVVENLSQEAAACGLNHDAIESALAKRLTDGGFTVVRNSDEDTYVYVNVMTSSLPDGLCVSRYDAFLYSYANATLSYRDRPVLAQVSLMHRGGMGGGPAATHGATVQHDLEGYLDLFMSQIRDANK